RRITRIKGWWLENVWEHFGGTSAYRRIMWLDADARLNAPLDFRLCPDREIIAGPWWRDPNDSRYDTITSGLLMFQGIAQGPVAEILRRWSRACVEQIEKLTPSTVPWADSDQEVLTHTLAEAAEAGLNVEILKLDHEKYVGIPTDEGKPQPNALVDHW